MNSRSIGSDIGQFAGQVEKGHLLAAAATATSAATKERKSHNVTHIDVGTINLDSSSDNSDASDTNQSNVMHSNTVSNIQNNITASTKSKRKSSENLNSTSSSNANVPVANAFQLTPNIDPEKLELLVTDENNYNQLIVHVQKRFSVEFADFNTASLPVNFATFKKTIFHEEYIKNILLLCCANNENLANKLFQNSELYEAILKHAHFHYFTKSNFRKVCPLRLKAAPVFIKNKFTFEAETAKDNGNAANVGDSLAGAESRTKSTASSSGNAEKTSQHPTAQAEHFKIPKPKNKQAAENKGNAAGNGDSLPANKKSMKCSSKADQTDQINCQPQTVQTENFQKPKPIPKKTQAIKAQTAKDKENAVDRNDSLPVVAVKRKSTVFSSQPETVQASPRKSQAVNEQVPNDKDIAGNDDDDSLPLAAVKRKSTAFSSHAQKTNCQPQTLQAEHFQIPKPINSPKIPQAVNEQTATGNAADDDGNLLAETIVDKNISLEEAKSLKRKNRLEKKSRFEKAKRIFVNQKDKHLRFDYQLATTFDLKQEVTECINTLGYDDFVRLAAWQNVGELNNYDKCEEFFKTIYQAMHIWPTNLYIPLEEFVLHVFFKNIAIPNDVTTVLEYISPKFMHWVDLIERTNYYECVEKYYFHIYGEVISKDDSTIMGNACEEYYQICYAADQWMFDTPIILDDYLIGLLQTTRQFDVHEDSDAEQLAVDMEEPTVSVPEQDVMEKNNTVALQDRSYVSTPSTQQQLEMLPDEIVISDDPLDAVAVGGISQTMDSIEESAETNRKRTGIYKARVMLKKLKFIDINAYNTIGYKTKKTTVSKQLSSSSTTGSTITTAAPMENQQSHDKGYFLRSRKK